MNVQDYFRIRLTTIRPDKAMNFKVYIYLDGKMHLYLNEGQSLSNRKIDSLAARDNGDSFFVEEKDKQAYRDWVREEINSEELAPLQKAKILRESSLAMMEDLFENPDVNRALDDSRPLVKEFIELMEGEPQAMAYMISLSGHDFYTYNHSLDVAIYALGLGKALQFDKVDMEELGVGALFHDVGKRNVALEILTKKGPLSDSEWEQMKRHPQYGLMILNDNPTISNGIKAACFEHHESWDGSGYPQNLVSQDIHPFARIVAITDTYDAMTTQRSYNVPLKPIDAVTMMKEKLSGRYDPDMLKAMYSILFKIKTGDKL